MDHGTTIQLGPGMAVDRVERVVGDDAKLARLVHVRTTVSSAAGCPQCAVVSTSVRQHRTTRPRDLPCGEEPLEVRWRKRQYRCWEHACPRKGFTERAGRSRTGTTPSMRMRERVVRAQPRSAAEALRDAVSCLA